MTVGYLLNTERGQEGEPGLFYNYILAGNGLFVRAKSPLLQATVQIAYAPVRGLLPLEERVELPMGSIPHYIYNLALSIFFPTAAKSAMWRSPGKGNTGSECLSRRPATAG